MNRRRFTIRPVRRALTALMVLLLAGCGADGEEAGLAARDVPAQAAATVPPPPPRPDPTVPPPAPPEVRAETPAERAELLRAARETYWYAADGPRRLATIGAARVAGRFALVEARAPEGTRLLLFRRASRSYYSS